MITQDLVNEHLRLDGDADEDYVAYLIEAATEYVSALTQITNDEDAPRRYDHACLLIIGHWYQNREAVTEQNLQQIPFGARMLINQLRPVGAGIGIVTPDSSSAFVLTGNVDQ